LFYRFFVQNFGHAAVVRLLIERSIADLEAVSKRGRTALTMAVLGRHAAEAKQLLGAQLRGASAERCG
jgi:ankyrin repeat protein